MQKIQANGNLIYCIFLRLLHHFGMPMHLPRSFRLLLLPLALASFSCSSPLPAADLYVLPSGAGSKNGSSWENAKAGDKDHFQDLWNALSPGDTLYVGSGTYEGLRISAGKGGEQGKPLRVVGVDRGSGLPLLTSNFDKNAPDKSGALFFEAKFGVSNFEVEGFRLKAYRCAVYMRGRNSNVKIAKLDVEEAREGVRSDGGGTIQNPAAGSHNITISDCRFVKYTKRGVRFEGGNYNCKVERCYADAGGKEWAVEPFHMGYQVANKLLKDSSIEHDIEFTDCTALNSYHEADDGKTFWNGDGFCSESGVTNLKFVRCVSMHNTDGGWDIKAESPEFIDCVSMDNKENFRLWCKTGAAKMTNVLSAFAHKRGGSGPETGLWILGSLQAQNCTFLGNTSQVSLDDKADPNATLAFKDCLFEGGKLPGGKQIRLVDSIVSAEGTAAADTGLKASKGTLWQTGSREFESSAHPDKGFSITRWSQEAR
jgi:hypothetical protein